VNLEYISLDGVVMELPRMAMIPKAWTDCENLYLNLAGKRKKAVLGKMKQPLVNVAFL